MCERYGFMGQSRLLPATCLSLSITHWLSGVIRCRDGTGPFWKWWHLAFATFAASTGFYKRFSETQGVLTK